MSRLKPVNIEPTKEWGSFVGLVLGDGSVFIYEHKKRHAKDYITSTGSTKPELVRLFAKLARKLGLHVCSVRGKMYTARVYSKALYEKLKPYKLEDYHFIVPNFVFQNDEVLAGFLRGFFDAEGNVYSDRIHASSKHKENLEQIQRALLKLGIRSYLVRHKENCYGIVIKDHGSIRTFASLVGFGLRRKEARLQKLLPNLGESRPWLWNISGRIEAYEKVMKLKKEGMKASEIAKLVGVPHDTVRYWVSGRGMAWGLRMKKVH